MPASIFQGVNVKLLKERLAFFNDSKVISSDVDPTSTATDGEKGDVLIQNGTDGGRIFIKQDSGSTTNWQLVGEGGELNFYKKGDAESASVSDFSTGNNPTFDGGGLLAGTFSVSTTAADLIRGNRSFKLVGSATAGDNTDDYVASEIIDIPQGYRGRQLGIKFQYKWSGTSGNVKWVVKDTTNGDILTLGTETLDQYVPSNDEAIEFNMAVFVPSDCEQIEIGPQIVTGEASETLIWDDVIVSPDPFVYKDVVQIEGYNGFNVSGSGTSGYLQVPSETRQDDTGTVTTRSTSGDFTVTALKPAIVTINASFIQTGAASGRYVEPRLDRQDGNGFQRVSRNGRANGGTSAPDTYGYGSASIKMEKGWELKLFFAAPSGSWNNLHITYTAIAQAEHVVTAAQSSETETKFLQSNVVSDNADIADLRFTNLVIGQKYMVTLSSKLFHSTTNADADVDLIHDGQTLIYHRYDSTASSTNGFVSMGDSRIFTATATSITVSFDEIGSSAFQLIGTGDGTGTYVQLTNITSQFLAAIPVQQTAYVKHVTSGTLGGGTTSSFTTQTRTLNVLEGDTGFLSLSSNQITIQPGTYYVEATADAYRVDTHQAMLYNTTDSAVELTGSTGRSDNGGDEHSTSFVRGRLVLTESKTFELRHWTQTGLSNVGFGLTAATGTNNIANENVFAQIAITKTK
jgi:hypothetical protein